MENDLLAAYLNSLARDDCYRVDSTLKRSPHETTEVVFFQGANRSELGPFIRKRFSFDGLDVLGGPGSDGAPSASGLVSCGLPLGDAYRVLFEAQQAGRRFRHLPRIYDVHEDGAGLVVIMEFVAGRTLRDEVYERDPSVELARRWFPLLCDGVAELHESFNPPLIHRDLKPTNIIVSEQGLVIVDFGIARTYSPGAEGDTTRFGTRSYAPPEQYGYGQTDMRSDVYALGAILHYLLTERDPSPATVRAGFADPDLPAILRPVLTRACAFDPADRFASAGELKAAFLKATANGRPLGTPAASAPSAPSAAFPPAQPVAAAIPPARIAASETGEYGRPPLQKRTVVTLVIWAILMFATMTLPFNPSEGMADWPLPLLMMRYSYAIPFFTGIALLIAGSPLMRFLLRCPPKTARRWTLVLGLSLMAAGFIIVGITDTVAKLLGLH